MTKYVLDTSAMLNHFYSEEMYCPPKVWEEVEKYREEIGGEVYSYYEIKVKILEPSKESLKRVEEASKETGDIYRLSEADKEVIALAIDLGGCVVTNDTSIQNVCATLNIPFIEFGGKRIRRIFKWKLRCTSCGRYFDRYYPRCPYCGGKLKTVLRKEKKGKEDQR